MLKFKNKNPEPDGIIITSIHQDHKCYNVIVYVMDLWNISKRNSLKCDGQTQLCISFIEFGKGNKHPPESNKLLE
jgi:hypothetical protein